MGHAIVAGGARASVPVTGILASDLAVGSSVYLMENGVAVEYLVVNQGIPSDSSLYDASCDGTWLLRKDIIESRVWDADNVNKLEISDIQSWLNSTMLEKYDEDVQITIQQVKIPYRRNGGSGTDYSGENGLSCKVFLLSGYEVGWTTSTSSILPVDGAVIEYFKGTADTDAKRIAYLNGTSIGWWLRSPRTNHSKNVLLVRPDGSLTNYLANYTYYGVRPALVLPSTAIFDETTLILKGVA